DSVACGWDAGSAPSRGNLGPGSPAARWDPAGSPVAAATDARQGTAVPAHPAPPAGTPRAGADPSRAPSRAAAPSAGVVSEPLLRRVSSPAPAVPMGRDRAARRLPAPRWVGRAAGPDGRLIVAGVDPFLASVAYPSMPSRDVRPASAIRSRNPHRISLRGSGPSVHPLARRDPLVPRGPPCRAPPPPPPR